MHRITISNFARSLAQGLAMAGLLFPTLAFAQVARVDDIRYSELPRAERPAPQRFELANGLTVILIEDHELPLVAGEVAIRTGGRHEPTEKIGLANLTGSVLRSGGTDQRPSDTLDDFLEDKAARIETRIGSTRGTATLSCLSEDLPEILRVFSDLLRNPAFEEDKLKVAKTQAISGISRQNDNAQRILRREFRQIIYGEDSPYTRDSTYETIGNISRQDLVDWHGKYFHPERIILGLVGDFDSTKTLDEIRTIFGAWPRGPEIDEPSAAYTKQARPGVFFVEKDDVTQSNIQMGHLGIQKDHPDYYPLEVMNQILGGSFASRLFSNVRSKKGLAYGVAGGVQSNYDYQGLFSLFTSTKTETTGAAIEALLEEARNMTAQPPTAKEISKAKASILNSFVFRSDTASEILSQQIRFEYFGYPLDWLERYRKGIETVTQEQVQAVAAEHIRLDEMAILVVGPAEGTEIPLDKFGTINLVDISIPEPPAAERQISAEDRQRGQALIAKAVTAMGGAERLEEVKNYRTKSTVTAQGPQGEMQLEMDNLIAFPDRVLSEITVPFGKITRVLNGTKAFVRSPQGEQELPPSQAEDLAKRLRRDPFFLLQQRASDGFSAAATGASEVNGHAVELVYVELDGEGITLGVEPDSGRILSRTFRGTGLTGAPGEMVEVRSDFRDVEGVELPFVVSTTFNGEPMAKAIASAIELNVTIDEAKFQQQP